MPSITDISPGVLRDRHRLSSQQINLLFGRQVAEESFEEKAVALGKVAEFLKVTDALSATGIRFIPLKGPLLSFRLYGDATIRHFSDLDILVDSPALSLVKDILEKKGYEAYGQSWPEGSRAQKRVLRYGHHISFVHPEKQTAFEIHWRLAGGAWLNFRRTDMLISQGLTSVDFEGRSFTALTDETELLFLIIHGGHHRWGMLKWLADVKRYLNTRKIDREKFTEEVRSLNAGRLVALCNAMLSEYFPGGSLIPCSSGVSKYMVRLSEKTIADASYTGPETIGGILINLRYAMNAYPGAGYKFRLLLGTINNSIFHGRLSRLFL